MKQRLISMATGLILAFVLISGAQASITVSPSSVNVVRGQGNTVAVTYQFQVISQSTLLSAEGEFISGATVLDRVNLPLQVRIIAQRAVVTETLVIPAGLIERALQRGSAQFTYRRIFTGGLGYRDATMLNLIVTGESIGQFGIKRISLYFENDRAETTVKKNQPRLKAFADISYIGSGLLKGYWEVDGRVLAQVNQPLMSGQRITFTTPEIPPLPTFETGTHTVRFVITSPAQGIPLPSLVYFVTADESVERQIALRLKSPADRADLPYTSQQFQWEEFASALYLVQYFEKPAGKPVFSAYTRKPYYKLPDAVLKSVFEPGRDYSWKVIAFDKAKRRTGESQTARFSFK